MRKVLTIGLFLNGLTCLNAGFLSEDICDYRSLNAIEYCVLGSPKNREDVLRRICYIETRQIYSRTPAANYKDIHLQKFMPGGEFDKCWGKTVADLLLDTDLFTYSGFAIDVSYSGDSAPFTKTTITGNYSIEKGEGIPTSITTTEVTEKKTSSTACHLSVKANSIIAIWFIRKAIDSKYDDATSGISAEVNKMKLNFLFFGNSYRTIKNVLERTHLIKGSGVSTLLLSEVTSTIWGDALLELKDPKCLGYPTAIKKVLIGDTEDSEASGGNTGEMVIPGFIWSKEDSETGKDTDDKEFVTIKTPTLDPVTGIEGEGFETIKTPIINPVTGKISEDESLYESASGSETEGNIVGPASEENP